MAQNSQRQGTHIKFSIVIPAYNEEGVLGPTLLSLKRLGTLRREFEVIVVDNNSVDHTSEVARKYGADKVVIEKQPGTNFAREAGRKVARGDIIVFLDADTTPGMDWLSRIEEDLSRKGVVAVSGPYDHGFTGIRRFLDMAYTTYFLPIVPKILRILFWRKAGVLIGGNFAAYAWALEKIGGLPPLKFYGDDVAIAMLLSRHVGKVFFDPGLRIKSSPRRFETEGFLSTALKYISSYLKIYFSEDYR